jgi:hypothetical protein
MRMPRPHTLRWAVLTFALAALTATAAAFHATNAAFTDSQSIDFTIASGTVALTRVGDALAFSSAPLVPGGDPVRATVRLRNAGSLASDITLVRTPGPSTSPGGCAARDALRIRVVADDDGDPDTKGDRHEVVDGPMADLGSAPIGRLDAGAARSFDVAVWLLAQHGATEADNDNCFEGSVDTEQFGFGAIEARP